MDGARIRAQFVAWIIPQSLTLTLRYTPRPARNAILWCMALCAAFTLFLVCCVVGRMVPAPLTSRAVDGRWYWVAPSHGRYIVSSRDQHADGVRVYIGMEFSELRGLGLFTTYRSHRVWWVDPGRSMTNAAIMSAVRERMADQGLPVEWIRALGTRGRFVGEARVLGEFCTGAVLVIPVCVIALLSTRLAGRAWTDFSRWRAIRANRCVRCRYSLEGLEIDDSPRCPECGKRRAAAPLIA